jgi:hypothetical protein
MKPQRGMVSIYAGVGAERFEHVVEVEFCITDLAEMVPCDVFEVLKAPFRDITGISQALHVNRVFEMATLEFDDGYGPVGVYSKGSRRSFLSGMMTCRPKTSRGSPRIDGSAAIQSSRCSSRSFSCLNLVSFTLVGPLSVIFQSGTVKIPSDHQTQDGSAAFSVRAGKTEANRSDLSGYHGRLNESNPKVCGRDPYPEG